VVAIKSFVAPAFISALLALLFTPVVLADVYTVKLDPGDQRWAASTLLTPHDFGFGWRGGPTTPEKPTGVSCPGFDPKASDLVVTGYSSASTDNVNAGVHVTQDLLVLSTSAAVQKDFARTIQPPLAACLEYQLERAPQVTAVKVEPLDFPRVGSVTHAYRATVTVKLKGATTKFYRDFVFFGNGRTELSLTVDAPVHLEQQLVPFETEMARILARRAGRRGTGTE
jgi:hypothetical protein